MQEYLDRKKKYEEYLRQQREQSFAEDDDGEMYNFVKNSKQSEQA